MYELSIVTRAIQPVVSGRCCSTQLGAPRTLATGDLVVRPSGTVPPGTRTRGAWNVRSWCLERAGCVSLSPTGPASPASRAQARASLHELAVRHATRLPHSKSRRLAAEPLQHAQ